MIQNPRMKNLTELQKGKIALNYMKMNSSPEKYNYLKRFISNDGELQVTGFDPVTGLQKVKKRDKTLTTLETEKNNSSAGKGTESPIMSSYQNK
jgi:hypothetical protein